MSLTRNKGFTETLDFLALFEIASSLRWLLIPVFLISLFIGSILWYLLQEQFEATSVINLQQNEGQGELSVAAIMTEKSILQDSSVIKTVIQSLGGAEAYLSEYHGRSETALQSEDLMLLAIEYYDSTLTVDSYPNSSIFSLTITGLDSIKTASLVNMHIDAYIAQDLTFKQLEYERLHTIMLAESENKFKELTLIRNELKVFATKNNVINLQLNDRDLVELSSDSEQPSLTLSPAEELKLDFLTRDYKRIRNTYFARRDDLVKHEYNFSLKHLVALVLASATVGEDVSPTYILVFIISVFIGVLVWCMIVICMGLLRGLRLDEGERVS